MQTLSETKHGNVLTCRALWETVLSEEDTERMDLLASMMPPLCWASLSPDDKKASVLQDLVHSFLNQIVDAFVRESLSSSSLLPASRSRRLTAKSLPEHWF